jgi:HAMP domain-containing protein
MIIVAAVVFYVLFAWLTQLYMIRPLRRLLHAVETWKSKGRFEAPEAETDDEIGRLVSALRVVSRASNQGEAR